MENVNLHFEKINYKLKKNIKSQIATIVLYVPYLNKSISPASKLSNSVIISNLLITHSTRVPKSQKWF